MTLRPLLRADPVRLGAYTLLGRLATGGMGRIYLGRSAAGDLVAVKTLLTETVADAVDRRRFAREVKVARRVHSPHTVRVLDADVEAEHPWMAIEYVPAPSLAELVRAAGPPGASTVRWIAAGGAAALCTLHSLGVEHRDLKPQNILLPADGVRIIDFGISHATDLTRTQLTLGTIAFTSPEQARGEPSTPASDVYSLGVTLFHTATGCLPYAEAEDPLRLLAQVARGTVDLSGLPSELVGLIRPCLSTDPANRPDPAALLPDPTAPLPGSNEAPAGSHRLPAGWAALIDGYERQGRQLAATPLPTPPMPAPTVPLTRFLPSGHDDEPARDDPPDEPDRPFAGLSASGWKAAGTFTGNLLLLTLFGLAFVAVVGTVIAIVVALMIT
ncbi:serine/threonine-protein kinase [Streptomyces sp. NPDC052299]|uniref:serine/threonine-protein kinase n=1 Tax=Streptomyces sp. NPDC052299 TaxID=3155054 RepID=UPI00343110AC